MRLPNLRFQGKLIKRWSENRRMNQMKIAKALPYVLSFVLPVVLFVINSYKTYISFPFDLIIYILSFYGVILITNAYFLQKLEGSMNFSRRLFKSVVDSWKVMREKILKLPRGESVTSNDLVEVLVEPGKEMNDVLTDTLFTILKGSPPSYSRMTELLTKAKQGTINRQESYELKMLFEEEEKRRENAGDIAGSILMGLAIIFILGIIASLFKE